MQINSYMTTQIPLKILICTEHNLYRNYLTNTIKQFSPKFEIVSEINNYKEITPIKYNDLDYLIVHFQNTIEDPITFVAFLKEEYRNVNIIVLTFWDDQNMNQSIIEAGVYDCHIMGSPIQNLLEKIELN